MMSSEEVLVKKKRFTEEQISFALRQAEAGPEERHGYVSEGLLFREC